MTATTQGSSLSTTTYDQLAVSTLSTGSWRSAYYMLYVLSLSSTQFGMLREVEGCVVRVRYAGRAKGSPGRGLNHRP